MKKTSLLGGQINILWFHPT